VNSLLFQSGYLTISRKEQQGTRIVYHLDYPNFEVQSSFSIGLANHLTGQGQEIAAAGSELVQALGDRDFPAFMVKVQALLGGIPHAWHDRGGLGSCESWQASLLYMSFRTTPVDLRAEELTSHGRSDMVLLHAGQVFVLEFKTVKGSSNMERKVREGLDGAIAQIREKGYAEKYRDRREPIHLIVLVFGRKKRNLLDILVEKL